MEAETGAETDIEIDAADELELEIAWDDEEARSASEAGGIISAFCAFSCVNTELWRVHLRTAAGFHFCLIALLLRPRQSPMPAHLLPLFLYLFLHLFLPAYLHVAKTVSLLQKKD